MTRRPGGRPGPTAVCAVAWWLVVAHGEPSAQPAMPEPVPAGPVQAAPVITFPASGLGLEEAVRLSLEHDPNVQLADEAYRRQLGVVQEQTGLFDLTLLGDFSYTYRVQELTESRKQIERDRRENLRRSLADNAADVERAREVVALLPQIRSAPPGSAQTDLLTQVSPAVGTQIQILDALIANANPDLRDRLVAIREQFIDDTLSDLETALTNGIAQFDAATQGLEDLGPAPEDEVFYDARGSVQFSKLFRNGITLAPFVDGSMEGTNFRGKPREEEFGGKGLEDLYTFRGGVSVLLPLARGRGRDGVGAFERAALAELEASRLASEHERSVSALTTTFAYWGLRAAQESADVAVRSVELYTELLDATQSLVTAGELPGIELGRAQAGDSRARATLEDAERQVHEARVELATVMGVATDGAPTSLPSAGDGFPVSDDPSVMGEVDAWLDEAVVRRDDLGAAQRFEDAGRIFARNAEVNLPALVDLEAGSWYTGLAERSISDAVDRWVGPSFGASLLLEKPFGNNVAEGRLASRQADLRQRAIEVRDIQRQIELNIIRAAQSVVETAERVAQVEAAVGFYNMTLDGELERFRAGESTLVDTVFTEQQRTDAEFSRIGAQLELARLIAELRFQTGTLLPDTGDAVLQNLVTLPPSGSQP